MTENNTLIQTGKAADMAGVNKETLRYYERNGLLDVPKRTTAGYRMYGSKDIERVKFIKNAQSLGFSLAEIKSLLDIADGEITNREDVRKVAKLKLETIEEQIEQLQSLRSVLSNLVQKCESESSICNCPIIESFSNGGTYE